MSSVTLRLVFGVLSADVITFVKMWLFLKIKDIVKKLLFFRKRG